MSTTTAVNAEAESSWTNLTRSSLQANAQRIRHTPEFLCLAVYGHACVSARRSWTAEGVSKIAS